MSDDISAKVAGFICKTTANFIGSVTATFLLRLIFFRPCTVRLHVDLAAAAAGNATPYDLTLNMTFSNRNRYVIWFDHLTAGLYNNGTKLGPSDETLQCFQLLPFRRRTVYSALHERASAAVAEAFNVDVRVKTTLTYQIWPRRATYYYEYGCWLQFTPPPGNGTPA